MAEYHEAFWVVVGTAAPVLALANAVTIGSALKSAITSAHALRKAGAATDKAFEVFQKPYMWAAGGFALDLMAMMIALFALLARSDVAVILGLGLGFVVTSMFLLAVQGLVLARAEATSFE